MGNSTSYMHTVEGRFIFAYLFEPKTKDWQGKPKDTPTWECGQLIPKSAADINQCPNIAPILAMMAELVATAPDLGGVWPSGDKFPVKDGDQQIAKYPHHAGHWIINAKNQFNPPVIAVLQNGVMQEVKAEPGGRGTLIKAGDFGQLSINAYTYPQGIAFGLEGVMKTRDGEALGQVQRSAQDIWGAGVAPAARPMGAGAPTPQQIAVPGVAQAAPLAPVAGVANPMITAPPTAYPSSPALVPLAPAAGVVAQPVSGAPMIAYPSSPAAAPPPVVAPVVQPAVQVAPVAAPVVQPAIHPTMPMPAQPQQPVPVGQPVGIPNQMPPVAQ